MLKSLLTALAISLSLWVADPLGSPLAQAQTPAGYINPPVYGTGIIPESKSGTVTTTIPASFNHPTNLVIYNIAAITNWSIRLPNPAFDGQMITIACITSVAGLAVTSTDGSTIASGVPTSCGAATTFTLQWSSTYNTWYIATGANASASNGIVNVRSLGLVCDGNTNDTTAWIAVVALLRSLNAGSNSVTLQFPGLCVIDWTTYQNITIPNLTLEGISGGGIRVSPGQTATGNLLTFLGNGNYTVKNFTLDLNSAAASGIAQGIDFQNGGNAQMTNSTVLNGVAPPSGSSNGMLEVTMYGTASCQILNNRFYFFASTIYQNQSLNFGSNGFPVKHCLIQGNYSKNSGFLFGKVSDDVTVDSNEVDGFGFGAAIAIGDPTDHAYKKIIVSNNNLHDGLAVRDVNNTAMHGIETWVQGLLLQNNRIDNMCGAGISIGQQSTVLGGIISNINTCNADLGDGAGIATVTASGSDPSGSFISGVKVFDTAGTTLYGFSDNVTTSTNITLGINDFNGIEGAYYITGGTSFAAPQLDNRVTNPCMAINQRNASSSGFTINNTWIADQWRLIQSHNYASFSNQTTGLFGNCPNAIQVSISSTQTPAATDFLSFRQNIPLNDVLDFQYSSAAAQSAILAFCAVTNIAPPFTGSVSLFNVNGGYSYVVNYTIATLANHRQCFSYRIPPDTHSLGATGTNTAFQLSFDIGAGTTEKTATTNAWVSGNFAGSTTATPFISNLNGSTIQFSNVRLLPAAADEGFEAPTQSEQLFNAQRFYQKSFVIGTAPAQNAGFTNATCTLSPAAASNPAIALQLNPRMNTAPSITLYNPAATNSNFRDSTAGVDIAASASLIGTTSALLGSTAPVTASGDTICIHWTADAGL